MLGLVLCTFVAAVPPNASEYNALKDVYAWRYDYSIGTPGASLSSCPSDNALAHCDADGYLSFVQFRAKFFAPLSRLKGFRFQRLATIEMYGSSIGNTMFSELYFTSLASLTDNVCRQVDN